MPDIGEVVETTWGEVIVDDLIVPETGADWRVSERAEDGTVTCINTKSGAALANTPHPAKAVKIRPRVPVRDAVETIANAFPDATVGAALADTRNSSICDACAARIHDPGRHRSWHEQLDHDMGQLYASSEVAP